MFFNHKPIKHFMVDGAIKDEANVPRLKEEYIKLLIVQMRETGYVPRIDIEPSFTLDYNSEKESFNFKLTIYGIFVGRKKTEWIIAVDGSRPISLQKSKLKEFLLDQESPLSQR